MLETLELIRDVGRCVMAYALIVGITGAVCGRTGIVEGEADPEPVIGAGELSGFGEPS